MEVPGVNMPRRQAVDAAEGLHARRGPQENVQAAFAVALACREDGGQNHGRDPYGGPLQCVVEILPVDGHAARQGGLLRTKRLPVARNQAGPACVDGSQERGHAVPAPRGYHEAERLQELVFQDLYRPVGQIVVSKGVEPLGQTLRQAQVLGSAANAITSGLRRP